MCDELNMIADYTGYAILGSGSNTQGVILGCELPDLEIDQAFRIWAVTGNMVHNIFRKILAQCWLN